MDRQILERVRALHRVWWNTRWLESAANDIGFTTDGLWDTFNEEARCLYRETGIVPGLMIDGFETKDSPNGTSDEEYLEIVKEAMTPQ